MKKAGTYLPSLIIAVLLVFGTLLCSAAIVADLHVTEERFLTMSETKKLDEDVYSRLERYYREKANSTGIPASVFTDALKTDGEASGYLEEVIQAYIKAGFHSLETGEKFSVRVPENKMLEDSITTFFNNYADESGYWDDLTPEQEEKSRETFDKHLESTISGAYKTIGNYSDVYKFETIGKRRLLSKLSKIYRHRTVLTVVGCVSVFAMLLLLVVVNRKERSSAMYWSGTGFLISGLMGLIPSAYLIGSKYYDSFSIKQPQIFKAVTGALYGVTKAFMAAEIAIAAIGIVLIAAYGVLSGINKKTDDIKTIE